jgi:hypothetical protein
MGLLGLGRARLRGLLGNEELAHEPIEQVHVRMFQPFAGFAVGALGLRFGLYSFLCHPPILAHQSGMGEGEPEDTRLIRSSNGSRSWRKLCLNVNSARYSGR